MGLWKNLKYVLSDECNGLLKLLADNYNKKTDKNEKTVHDILIKVQQTLDTQEVIDNNLSDTYQELRENKEAAEKIYNQYSSITEQCEAIVSQMNQMETRSDSRTEEIEKIFEAAVEKQNEEFAKRSQVLSKRIREIFDLIEAQNVKDPDEPDIDELFARIDMLEKKNEEYENQLTALQNELTRTQEAYQTAEKSYQDEKRRTFDLSKKLVQSNDKISDLLSRMKDRALEDMIKKDDTETDSPFSISANKDKYTITAGNVQVMVMKFANTSVLDHFFERVPDQNTYKKMYDRYQKNIRATARQFSAGADLEEVLQAFLAVVQEELVNKILESVSGRMKTSKAEFEKKLLAVLNQYLESAGFYSRDEIRPGQMYKAENYKDMECVKTGSADGKQQGEIVEVEIYPYYINYIDKNGKRKRMHTKGIMAVAG